MNVNLSAEGIDRLCRRILDAAGVADSGWNVETKVSRDSPAPADGPPLRHRRFFSDDGPPVLCSTEELLVARTTWLSGRTAARCNGAVGPDNLVVRSAQPQEAEWESRHCPSPWASPWPLVASRPGQLRCLGQPLGAGWGRCRREVRRQPALDGRRGHKDLPQLHPPSPGCLQQDVVQFDVHITRGHGLVMAVVHSEQKLLNLQPIDSPEEQLLDGRARVVRRPTSGACCRPCPSVFSRNVALDIVLLVVC